MRMTEGLQKLKLALVKLLIQGQTALLPWIERALKVTDSKLHSRLRLALEEVLLYPITKLIGHAEGSQQRLELRLVDLLATMINKASTADDQSALERQRSLIRQLLLLTLPETERELVPSLHKRQEPVCNTWTYQNTVMQWEFSEKSRVLDVGSGGWPFSLATHLADKHPDVTSHRFEALVKDKRPFFEVDLETLPFQDQSFDFIFCSHVLEHMNRPGDAMRELMRVGKAGYIEVPTRLSDVMFNFTRLQNHHRWHGLVQGDTIILTEWNEWERRELGNHYFNSLQSSHHNTFQDFFENNRDLFFASHQWQGGFCFMVIDKHGAIIDSSDTKPQP